jgi:hypothetical protein
MSKFLFITLPATLLGPFGKQMKKDLRKSFQKNGILRNFPRIFDINDIITQKRFEIFFKFSTDRSSQNPAQNNIKHCNYKFFFSSKLNILQ